MKKLTEKQGEVKDPPVTGRCYGCFTKLKCITGAKLSEIEVRLGFESRRLSMGAYILQAVEKPTLDKFDIAGYTHIPIDQFSDKFTDPNTQRPTLRYNIDKLESLYGIPARSSRIDYSGYDDRLKRKQNSLDSIEISGIDSLVKIIPVADGSEYPSSADRIPQYLIDEKNKEGIMCKVIAFVEWDNIFTLASMIRYK